ncbi:large ribosomal subunit protein bL19m [Neocloeon triangulifer]|uniref:large ribosomal subunit protein bL19m n=1 Tax=Neocloeon triangulifer TaxID=2078957 RepID=UPI00286F1AAB|nr:large ribosomal subunit protein bL19m [Neocloeon triangulifer]
MANLLLKTRNSPCVLSAINQLAQRFVSSGQTVGAAAAVVAEEKATVETQNERKQFVPSNYRFVYPEFLPDPNLEFRNLIREKLEQADMISRRTQVEVPEFHVGSILAVTCSDQHAVGKTTRFVGICIQRMGCGLRANFTLRNVVDNLGVEIKYEIYDPRLQKVQVLRLEKRLDDELLYLRDAPPEYSTFSFNMEQEFLNEGAIVPINPIKVPLRPPPWYARWERLLPKGAVIPELSVNRTEKSKKWIANHSEPWEKYDLMKQYRKTIPEEEQNAIFADAYSELHQLEIARKKLKRKKNFVKPKKSA